MRRRGQILCDGIFAHQHSGGTALEHCHGMVSLWITGSQGGNAPRFSIAGTQGIGNQGVGGKACHARLVCLILELRTTPMAIKKRTDTNR
mmetsp:Transcript_9671/g.14917  ORF Transcript_9671/g.14917 Transcript_9671/m.14917 type:complete len:90 (+) Transcript_9671:382-651(+)